MAQGVAQCCIRMVFECKARSLCRSNLVISALRGSDMMLPLSKGEAGVVIPWHTAPPLRAPCPDHVRPCSAVFGQNGYGSIIVTMH